MKKVLIIDDEDDMLDILRYSLEAEHFEVHTAKDGVEGLVKALRELPSVIVTDVMMHNLDGCAMLEEFRSHVQIKHIPIVVLTGMGHLKRRFEADGIVNFFEKPFQTAELVARIKLLSGS